MVSREEFGRVNLFRFQSTKPFEGAPQGRVELERLAIILDSVLVLSHELSDLTEKEKSSSTIRYFLELLRVHQAEGTYVILVK